LLLLQALSKLTTGEVLVATFGKTQWVNAGAMLLGLQQLRLQAVMAQLLLPHQQVLRQPLLHLLVLRQPLLHLLVLRQPLLRQPLLLLLPS
jgi:hypothetical protein